MAIALVVASSAAVATPVQTVGLTSVARFGHQITGVAVTADGRRFVNFPRWTDDAPVSVAEVLPGGALRPYPDAAWNAWRNASANQQSVADHFVCVQSVVPDGHGHLWAVDAGAPGNEKILPGAPKLVRIDLASNRVDKVIPMGPDLARQGSYLNDIRFAPDGRTAYLTDSGSRGAIVVVDLDSGKGARALDGDPSTQVEKDVTVTVGGKPLRRPDGRQPMFAADGLALSTDGGTLYFQALTGRTLYAVDAATLRSDPAHATARRVATTTVADGLWMSRAGTLYLTSPTDDSVKRLAGDHLETVVADPRLRWPDTMAEGPDGRIYVTASHIQDSAWFKPGAPASLPTELYSFMPTEGPTQ